MYAGSSEFGDYRVVDMSYEGRPARVLFSGENAGQSGIALDDDPALLFDYNQRFLEIVESLRPEKILIIGGGAFTLPSELIRRFERTIVDVVEIDPLLYELGKQYFNTPIDSRLRVFNEDGRTFINESKDTYDLIILDAFSGYTIPRQLITVEAAQQYSRLLEPQGVLTVNFIATYRSLRTTLANELFVTFTQIFSSTQVFPADRDYWTHAEQNLLLVCCSHEPSVDYLQSSAVKLLRVPTAAILYDNQEVA